MKTLCNCLRRALGSRADELLGVEPERYRRLQDALLRIARLPHNLELSSAEIGIIAVINAENALGLPKTTHTQTEILLARQAMGTQSQVTAGGKQ